jgi:lysozyme
MRVTRSMAADPSRRPRWRRGTATTAVLAAATALFLVTADVSAAPSTALTPAGTAAGGSGRTGGAGGSGSGSGGEGAGVGQGSTQLPAGSPDAGTGPVRRTLALPTGWPQGVDVSSWQHPGGKPIDWAAVARTGAHFAIIKASEGTKYANPYFPADRDAARKAGLVVGAYHYARPALPISTAVDQAKKFIQVIGTTRDSGTLAPVLDLEVRGGLNADQLAQWAAAFLAEVVNETGRAPILYTYRSFWTDYMKNVTSFMNYPLWFALYNNASSPGALPGGWRKWLMWQYTSSGAVSGIPGKVDMSAFCCSASALTDAAQGKFSEISRRYFTDASVPAMLGAATKVEGPASRGGRYQPFQNGLMYYSADTGVRVLKGAIAKKYLSLGGTTSVLRRPLSDEQDASAPGSRQTIFQGGRIYWSQGTGAFEVNGSILARYVALGGTASSLGLPVSDEHTVPGGRASTFTGGVLVWNAKTNKVSLVAP